MPCWVFLRHGESLANARRVLSGWIDVPLTPRGEDQARRAGRLLAERFPRHLPGDRVLSSDLVRARETARLAVEAWAARAHQPPPIIELDPRLRERNLGEMQDVGVDEARADGRMRQVLGWDSRPAGGESLQELAGRALAAMIEHDDGRGGVVVAHGGVLRVLTGMAEGLSAEQIGARRVENARLVAVDVVVGGWNQIMARYSVRGVI